MTRACSVNYDKNTEAPLWLSFLSTIMMGRQDMVEYLQRVAGYCLTGNVEERCFWIMHGHQGTNGKSTFFETLTFILSDYAKTAEPQTILKRGDDTGPRNDIARLQSARLVTVSEIGKGKHLDENTIKQMSGADRLTARFLYSEMFEFNPQFKILLITNHLPRISVDDPALWNRVKRIPFDYRVPDEKIDRKLKEKLRAEAPGILAWAVRGCLEWQRNGLSDPKGVTSATNEYKSGEDTIKQFLDAACYVDTNNQLISINGNALLEKYHAWSGNNKMYSRSFYEALEQYGIMRDRRRDGIYLKGVALAADDDPVFRQPAPDKTDDKEEAMRKAGLF
jgi:putative DNA primase/helicase